MSEEKNTSEAINELAAALAKAQGEMEPAVLDTINPFYKNKYASLASVNRAIKQPLSKNNLSVTQTTLVRGGEKFLVTKLMHSSGQWVSGEMPLLMSKADMQGLGSAMTYARRFGVSGITGVVTEEDDDGNVASNVAHEKPIAAIARQTHLKGKPSEAQLKRLFAISKSANWDSKSVTQYMDEHFGKIASSELTIDEYNKLCEVIEKNPVKPIEDDFPFETK